MEMETEPKAVMFEVGENKRKTCWKGWSAAMRLMRIVKEHCRTGDTLLSEEKGKEGSCGSTGPEEGG